MPADKFPTELKLWKYWIERVARRFGLSFSPIYYEVVSQEEMAEVGAYVGYPARFHHWTWGQSYLEMIESIMRGSIYYELVIPGNPSNGYLSELNAQISQKTVMAHVCGHADFFRNNAYFRGIPDDIVNLMADDARRMDALREEVGKERFDKFVDACMSIDTMVDLSLIDRDDQPTASKSKDIKVRRRSIPDGLPDYLDDVINTDGYLKEEEERVRLEKELATGIEKGVKLPVHPVRDVLVFLARHGKLESWQREVLWIIHLETLLLRQGAQTRIMNEGWATIWEHVIMNECGAILNSELIEFSKQSAGVLRSPYIQINPYYLGMVIWRDIERRWNTGRHGRIYEESPYKSVRDRWDEFAVFKHLVDCRGSCSPDLISDWKEFQALIRETASGRGVALPAFFSEDDYIAFWLEYEEAESRLSDLFSKRTEVEQFEREIYGKVSGDKSELSLLWFQAWHHGWASKGRPDSLLWTLAEIDRRIRKLEKVISLKHRIRNGEIPPVEIPIPDEWFDWAAQFPETLVLADGLRKIFEIRRTHCDVTFIGDFLTDELIFREGYHTIGVEHDVIDPRLDPNNPVDAWVIKSRQGDRVRAVLKSAYVNLGVPVVEIVDANVKGNSGLYVVHLHDGRDLDEKMVQKVMPNLWLAWGGDKPVHLESKRTTWPKRQPWWTHWSPSGRANSKAEPKVQKIVFSYDGQRVTQSLD